MAARRNAGGSTSSRNAPSYETELSVNATNVNVEDGYDPDGAGDDAMMDDVPLVSGVGGSSGQEQLQYFDEEAGEIDIPTGHWRDGFWDMLNHGFFHWTVWTSCCCTLVGAAHVMTRLQLNMLGKPTTVAEAALIFPKIVYIVVCYWITRLVLFLIIFYLDPNTDRSLEEYIHPSGHYFFFAALDDILWYIYFIYMVIVIKNIRKHVRNKYSIPESGNCRSGYEDCCFSCFCPCFSISQLMRHTTNYDRYPAYLCTDTGLPSNVPSIV